MKYKLRYIAVVIATIVIAISTARANVTATDTADFVVNGVILKTNKKHDSKCKLELFYENKKIDSSIVKMDRLFEFFLKKNVWYTLRVTKEGYVPLTISFNTELKNGEEIINNLFTFETALIEEEEAKSMNQELLDLPVGIVAFNKETKIFEALNVYSSNYIASLFKITELPADIAKEFVSKKSKMEFDMA